MDSLLFIAFKIFAHTLLNRLVTVSQRNFAEMHCGFQSEWNIADMIFAVRQVQEKCTEQSKTLYSVFIDPTKAFDTVNTQALWIILRHYRCSRKFTKLI